VIYFIESGRLGPIKIGFTKYDSVTARVSQLQTAHPHELTLLFAMKGGLEREAEMHRTFAPERMRGEWFRSSQRLLGFIASQYIPKGDRRPLREARDDEPWQREATRRMIDAFRVAFEAERRGDADRLLLAGRLLKGVA
jgi:hypothetical protein